MALVKAIDNGLDKSWSTRVRRCYIQYSQIQYSQMQFAFTINKYKSP